jgi:hypothetical protein
MINEALGWKRLIGSASNEPDGVTGKNDKTATT